MLNILTAWIRFTDCLIIQFDKAWPSAMGVQTTCICFIHMVRSQVCSVDEYNTAVFIISLSKNCISNNMKQHVILARLLFGFRRASQHQWTMVLEEKNIPRRKEFSCILPLEIDSLPSGCCELSQETHRNDSNWRRDALSACKRIVAAVIRCRRINYWSRRVSGKVHQF